MNDSAGPLLSSIFFRYHCRTKHTLESLYSSEHRLDWANQPNPFRTYEGATGIGLPEQIPAMDREFFQTLNSMDGNPSIDIEPLTSTLLSALLYYSMAISAWKQIVGTQHKWALRVNPSSGNLHPTETHILLNAAADITAGAYHYRVDQHRLEQRSSAGIGRQLWSLLGRDQAECPPLLLCLTSIFWREAWKYRDRAFRYCNHDLGHALGAIRLSAALLGWRVQVFGEFPDRQVEKVLALEATEEHPLALVALYPVDQTSPAPAPPMEADTTAEFAGRANCLSEEQLYYSPIQEVYEATVLSETRPRWHAKASFDQAVPPGTSARKSVPLIAEDVESDVSAGRVIRTRRSAVDMDGRRRTSLARLSQILRYSTRGFPADFFSGDKNAEHSFFIHLYVYAHRIDGLDPGIYYFDRQRQMLLLVKEGAHERVAKFVSCLQDIAADGCFAVSMIADFNCAYERYGDRCYRYVHFEAGYIGQMIYLSSHALGLDSTGIGCFMDDEINHYLQLPPGFEVIYNFTVGQAVIDPRLTDLPSYGFAEPGA